jgi:Ricin-type beta-trefoil lectin domain
MRKSHRRRLVIPLVVFGLVAAGGIGVGLTLVANAQTTSTFCDSSGTPITCTTDTVDITDPSAITLVVDLLSSDGNSDNDQYVEVTWEGDCDQGSNTADLTTPASPGEEATLSSTSDATVNVPLPYTDPDDCTIEASATLYSTAAGTGTTGSFQLNLEYTTWASSTSTSTTSSASSVDVPYVYGYSNKCIDDKGNSSSNGAEVIIWGCNHGDSAQYWTWTGYELRHDGMCANDPGYGGSGTKLILYTCTGTSNEKWSHVSYGEFKLYYTGKGQLCLDDPGYSKTNGTRLMVYKCNNGSNQRWARS